MRLTARVKVGKFGLSLLDKHQNIVYHFPKKSVTLWIIQRSITIMSRYFFITVSTHFVSLLA